MLTPRIAYSLRFLFYIYIYKQKVSLSLHLLGCFSSFVLPLSGWPDALLKFYIFLVSLCAFRPSSQSSPHTSSLHSLTHLHGAPTTYVKVAYKALQTQSPLTALPKGAAHVLCASKRKCHTLGCEFCALISGLLQLQTK